MNNINFNKIISLLFLFILLLSALTRNFYFIVPFHFFLCLFCCLVVALKIKILSKFGLNIFFGNLIIFLFVIVARGFEGIGNDIFKVVYFLIILPFFIGVSLKFLLDALGKKKLVDISLKFFLILNLLGLAVYFYLSLTNDYSDLIKFYSSDVSDSRKVLLNSIESFVFVDQWGYRYSGYYLDPNRWSFCLLFMYVFTDAAEDKINLIKINKIIILLSLLLTFSKAGLLSFLIYFSLRSFLGNEKSKFLWLLIIVSVGLMVSFVFADFNNLIERGLYALDSDNSKSRLNVWPEYFSVITKHWINFLFGSYVNADLTDSMPINPHNILLFIGYQLGAVGLLWFCVVYFFVLGKIFSFHSKNKAIFAAGLISLGIMNFSEDYLLLPIFWFVLFYFYLYPPLVSE